MRIALRSLQLCLVFLLAGCVEALSPLEVSGIYWRAVRDVDVETLRRHVTLASGRASLAPTEVLPVSEARFGRIVIDGNEARVETTVTIPAGRPVSLPLQTVLLLEEGEWRVDYRATMDPLSRSGQVAKVIDSIEELSALLRRKVDDTLAELEKSLPEVERELQRLEEHIRTELPELQKRLKEFARELEEALKRRRAERPIQV